MKHDIDYVLPCSCEVIIAHEMDNIRLADLLKIGPSRHLLKKRSVDHRNNFRNAKQPFLIRISEGYIHRSKSITE